MQKGSLVPVEFINNLILELLNTKHKDYSGYLFDGYPRSLEQAEFFYKQNKIKPHVIYFEIDPKVAADRIKNRIICLKCSNICNINSEFYKAHSKCDKCGGDSFTRNDDTDEL